MKLPAYRRWFVTIATMVVGIWPMAVRADDGDELGVDPDLPAALYDEVVVPTPYGRMSLAAFQQPPSAAPSPGVSTRGSRVGSLTTRERLARSPNMFGDSQLLIRSAQPDGTGNEIPVRASFGSYAVGSRKIAENEKVMPMDRVFASYNEFHGLAAPLSSPFTPPTTAQMSRVTLGFEKTFFDGMWSFETRVAACNTVDMALASTSYDGGTPAALTFYLKNLLWTDGVSALGAGLGVGVPITSDVIISTESDTLRYSERTTHLMPYVGFLTAPTDDWFVQGFAQLDFAAGSNQLESMGSGRPSVPLAELPEQQLFFADVSIGRWLWRDFEAPLLTGLAGVFEMHYITTLNDSNVVNVLGPPTGPFGGPSGQYTLSSVGNRIDVLNLTGGLQMQFGPLANLRVAGVAPVTTGFNRFFDGELQVSFNRQF